MVPDIISLRVADNKEATEQRVPSGYVEVITSKVLRSPQGSVNRNGIYVSPMSTDMSRFS